MSPEQPAGRLNGLFNEGDSMSGADYTMTTLDGDSISVGAWCRLTFRNGEWVLESGDQTEGRRVADFLNRKHREALARI